MNEALPGTATAVAQYGHFSKADESSLVFVLSTVYLQLI
jgi:hypothetical protein